MTFNSRVTQAELGLWPYRWGLCPVAQTSQHVALQLAPLPWPWLAHGSVFHSFCGHIMLDALNCCCSAGAPSSRLRYSAPHCSGSLWVLCRSLGLESLTSYCSSQHVLVHSPAVLLCESIWSPCFHFVSVDSGFLSRSQELGKGTKCRLSLPFSVTCAVSLVSFRF